MTERTPGWIVYEGDGTNIPLDEGDLGRDGEARHAAAVRRILREHGYTVPYWKPVIPPKEDQ